MSVVLRFCLREFCEAVWILGFEWTVFNLGFALGFNYLGEIYSLPTKSSLFPWNPRNKDF